MAFYAISSVLALIHTVNAASISTSAPTVTVRNGTLAGRYLPEWNQDAFLGIPYAQPPVGPLRFKWPQSINQSYSGVRDASKYGNSCYQYGSNFNLSEDCLTLNVVRPRGQSKKPLPVLVWIYGGGLYAGSTADPQYNISGIVNVGQTLEPSAQPIIGVSLNYRLGVWGFLQTPQILAEGSSNAGLLDQRLALRWIKENIAAFGGDPDRITVWGESAGAQSISLQLLAYDGRNDNLFQSAILESGSPVGAQLQALPWYAAHAENLTRTTGCYTAKDQLACLRTLSSETLFKDQVSTVWNPLPDGDFLTGYPDQLIPEGKFIKLPLLIGANSDEGSSFSVSGVNNDTALFDSLFTWRSYQLTPPTIRKLMQLYPNDLTTPKPPFAVPPNVTFPSKGLEWRRSAAIGGDLVMIAGRRKMCEIYTDAGQPVYSYRFDTPLWNATATDGVKHFVNVVFSFQNISGALGPLPKYQSYQDLSRGIGESYVRFVNGHDPNFGRATSQNKTLPTWPQWTKSDPVNMVLNSNRSFVEPDTWRQAGINFINTIWRELLA